jgi:hypothetical protein
MPLWLDFERETVIARLMERLIQRWQDRRFLSHLS